MLKKKSLPTSKWNNGTFEFQNALKMPAETIAEFEMDLQRLSGYCNFGNTLNYRMCIQEARIQRKLLDTKQSNKTNSRRSTQL